LNGPRYHPPTQLWDHQLKAARFFMNNDGVGLFHGEVGVGKTLPALAVAGGLQVRGRIEQLWIFCPLGAIGIWQDALAESYGLEYFLWSQGKQVSLPPDKPFAAGQAILVNIMTYEMGTRRFDWVEKTMSERSLVICDEVQKIKSATAKRSKALAKVARIARYRLGLSGTPAPNGPLDYFGVFRFIRPGLFPRTWTAFKNRYGVWAEYPRHWLLYRYQRLDELQELIGRWTFTATKAECLDLPPKTRELVRFDLGKERRVYDDLKREYIAYLKAESKRTGQPVSRVALADHILTRFLRLAEVCGGFVHTETGEVEAIGTTKLRVLNDILEPLLEAKERVLVFCRFRAEHAAIVSGLEGTSWVGSIKGGDTLKGRIETIKDFQTQDRAAVLVLSIGAAAEAINLSCAAYTIFYSIDFDYAHVDQADARNDRPPQDRKMTTYFLLARDTIDERMYDAVARKKKLSDWIAGFVSDG